ncbi:MAG TPA: hypothetical protein PLH16_00500, partial [Candidatus Omnitrophota bacterium]|nr:hypothetical protein [Candidatus Omnitrophota bacterium]
MTTTKYRTRFWRVTSCLTVLCFILNQAAFAAPSAGIEIAVPQEKPGFIQIDIPADLASLDDIFEAPPSTDPRLVLHIQNAHANYDAQTRIKGLLEYLSSQYGIGTIFVEGAADTLNPEYLKFFPDAERNRMLADRLARKGELTGAELFVLEADRQKIRAEGIESAGLYRKNYEALKAVYENETVINRFVDGLESRLSMIASKIAGGDMRRVISDWKKFENGYREFMPYVRSLAADAKRFLDLDMESLFSQVEWPQITRLLVLQDMEKQLNPAKAAAEQASLLAYLKKVGVSGDLIDGIVNFRDQHISITRKGKDGSAQALQPRYLLERLASEAGPKGFRFSDYPHFSVQAGYLILKSELDSRGLFAEIQRLFGQVLDRIAVSGEQKQLLALYRDTELVRKLLHLELTRRDWKELEARRAELALDPVMDRLKALAKQIRADLKLAQTELESKRVDRKFRGQILDLYKAADEFYGFARAREDVFYEKISGVMSSRAETRAVLITGGFHTDGMSDIFRENEISYGILTPRLSEKSDEKLYRSSMLQRGSTIFDTATIELFSKMLSADVIEAMGANAMRAFALPFGESMDLTAETSDSMEEIEAQLDFLRTFIPATYGALGLELRYEVSENGFKVTLLKKNAEGVAEFISRPDKKVFQVAITRHENVPGKFLITRGEQNWGPRENIAQLGDAAQVIDRRGRMEIRSGSLDGLSGGTTATPRSISPVLASLLALFMGLQQAMADVTARFTDFYRTGNLAVVAGVVSNPDATDNLVSVTLQRATSLSPADWADRLGLIDGVVIAPGEEIPLYAFDDAAGPTGYYKFSVTFAPMTNAVSSSAISAVTPLAEGTGELTTTPIPGTDAILVLSGDKRMMILYGFAGEPRVTREPGGGFRIRGLLTNGQYGDVTITPDGKVIPTPSEVRDIGTLVEAANNALAGREGTQSRLHIRMNDSGFVEVRVATNGPRLVFDINEIWELRVHDGSLYVGTLIDGMYRIVRVPDNADLSEIPLGRNTFPESWFCPLERVPEAIRDSFSGRSEARDEFTSGRETHKQPVLWSVPEVFAVSAASTGVLTAVLWSAWLVSFLAGSSYALPLLATTGKSFAITLGLGALSLVTDVVPSAIRAGIDWYRTLFPRVNKKRVVKRFIKDDRDKNLPTRAEQRVKFNEEDLRQALDVVEKLSQIDLTQKAGRDQLSWAAGLTAQMSLLSVFINEINVPDAQGSVAAKHTGLFLALSKILADLEGIPGAKDDAELKDVLTELEAVINSKVQKGDGGSVFREVGRLAHKQLQGMDMEKLLEAAKNGTLLQIPPLQRVFGKYSVERSEARVTKREEGTAFGNIRDVIGRIQPKGNDFEETPVSVNIKILAEDGTPIYGKLLPGFSNLDGGLNRNVEAAKAGEIAVRELLRHYAYEEMANLHRYRVHYDEGTNTIVVQPLKVPLYEVGAAAYTRGEIQMAFEAALFMARYDSAVLGTIRNAFERFSLTSEGKMSRRGIQSLFEGDDHAVSAFNVLFNVLVKELPARASAEAIV